MVIQYAEVGGFVPREFAFQQTPNVLVSGDGRVFGPGAQIEIYPGPLLPAVQVQSITEEGIQAILAAADEAGLFAQIDYEQPTNIADASTAQVTINVDGQTYVHEAYALGLANPGEPGEETTPERQALADFIAQLMDLPTLVGADQLGEQTMFEADEYGIEALVVDDLSVYGTDGIEPTVVDWPAEATVRLADAAMCTVVSADEVGEALARGQPADVLHRRRRDLPGPRQADPARHRLRLTDYIGGLTPDVIGSEEAEVVGLHAAQGVVVDLDPAEPAGLGEHLRLGLDHLGDEHATDLAERRVELQPFDVAGELLDAVDLAASLHLDGHHGVRLVAAHEIDRPDRRRVLAAHEGEALLDRVRARGQQLLEVGLDAVLLQARDPRRARPTRR